jgi:diguanylate cyclase (GGDEF)-like protein
MRNTGLEAAKAVTQKVIDLMAEYQFPLPKDVNLKLGITAGVAIYPMHAYTPSDLLRAADAALYYAKKHYRGKYVIAKGVTGKLSPIQVNEESN